VKGDIYDVTTLVFPEHRIQLHRMGHGHRPIYLAGTPPAATGRGATASAHPAQLPLHRVSISGPRGVSADLPSTFAYFAAYGDIVAAILALLALSSLSSTTGVVIAWIFSLWGSADLFNAFYQANRAGLMAGQLGAAYFIPTIAVPLLLITHGLAFRILLQPQNVSAVQQSPRLA
jgi:hypothetical protein